MTPSQPLLATPVTANTMQTEGSDESRRLLAAWTTVTAAVIAAEAHTDDDQPDLRELQLRIEDELTRRVPQANLDELIVFEASVLHKDEETTPENCLICRTANAGPPVRLALGAGWGGTR
jgi:hypothetical protein